MIIAVWANEEFIFVLMANQAAFLSPTPKCWDPFFVA